MSQTLRVVQTEVCVSAAAVDNGAINSAKQRSFPKELNRPAMTDSVSMNGAKSPSSDSAVDHKLVIRVQQGDRAAFDLLVTKYQGRVASIISRYVADRHEIADVAQEAFIKAFRAIDKFRADSAFYTWLYRIAVNCAKNYLIAKGRKTPSVDVDIDDAEYTHSNPRLEDNSNPADQVNRDQLERLVFETIRGLPEELKLALSLREFEGLSYEEIANVMDCPVGTVRSRIFRAREAVDKVLAKAQGESL